MVVMRKIIILLLTLLPVVIRANPTILNLQASQRTDATRMVDIYYNVIHDRSVTVSIYASQDNGVTWNLSINLVSGDVGPNIVPGNGKHIVWDVLAEYPNIIYDNVKFKVVADDGQAPEGFVYVPGGTFSNGTSNVTVSSFVIDIYELTQASFESVMGSNPAIGYGTGPDYPVYKVSWFTAIEYCNRRSIQEGLMPCYSYSDYGTIPSNWPSGWNTNNSNHTNVNCDWSSTGYRLLTEMEWMFAARGGNLSQGYTYSGSNNVYEVAWTGGGSHIVGTKLPNELGLYDMSGNVAEWVWDIFGPYASEDQINPTGPSTGLYRSFRGGCWSVPINECEVTFRKYALPTINTDGALGFRVCRKP